MLHKILLKILSNLWPVYLGIIPIIFFKIYIYQWQWWAIVIPIITGVYIDKYIQDIKGD